MVAATWFLLFPMCLRLSRHYFLPAASPLGWFDPGLKVMGSFILEALEFGTLSPSVFLKFELRLLVVSDSGLRLLIGCLFFFFKEIRLFKDFYAFSL